jgi:hypothetical protein
MNLRAVAGGSTCRLHFDSPRRCQPQAYRLDLWAQPWNLLASEHPVDRAGESGEVEASAIT